MNNSNVIAFSLTTCLTILVVCCRPGNGNYDTQSHPSQELNSDSIVGLTNEAKSDTSEDSKQVTQEAIFTVPDNIDKSRLVVAFHDKLCKCPIAIVYDNAKGTKATRLTFYSDGKIDRKKLIPLSASSFGERFEDWTEDKPHYEIYPAIVQYVYTNGSIGATYEVMETE